MGEKKYTLSQFDSALTALGVDIDEIKYIKNEFNVTMAIGYKLGQKYKWNKQGQCFCQNGNPNPAYDLKFD